MKFEKMRKEIFCNLKKNKLIEENDKVMVGVSGGPDSIFLLHFLNKYKQELKISTLCAHINHSIRSQTSDRDEIFVGDMCKRMKIPFVSRKVDALDYSKNKQLSLEDAARRLRLKNLEIIAKEMNADKIALGHTLDDCIETFFLNLFRGTGRKGILGIKSKRGIFIRPLLSIKKDEIVQFLKRNKIDYKIDVTNWIIDYKRNFIRRKLFPSMEEEFGENVKRKIAQALDIYRNEEKTLNDIVDSQIHKIVKKMKDSILLDSDRFRKLDIAIQRRIIIKCFEGMVEQFRKLNFEQIESLRKAILSKSSGLRFSYYGIGFLISQDSVLIRNENDFDKKSRETSSENEILEIPGEFSYENNNIIVTSIIKEVNGDMDNPDCTYFDLDKIKPPLTLRKRLNGDRFIPFGMDHKKKLKDLFIDCKIPFWKRDNIPLILDSKGIIWVVGVRRCDRAKIGKNTKRILKIEKRKIG
jgi:tRNA(Ile)-lysidine synthase